MRAVLLLLMMGTLAGCDRNAVRSGRAQPGSPADSELTVAGDTVAAANTSVELEAPRLIPGLRAQLSALRDPKAGLSEGNITAYRTLAGDVVTSMMADLNRLGSPEADQVRALGDSVVRLIGGGAGDAPAPPPERVTASVEVMDRLIRHYQDAVREAQR